VSPPSGAPLISVDPRARQQLKLAGWVEQLGAPARESASSRRWAHLGGLASLGALVGYLVWRVAFTLPVGGWNLAVAITLVCFEALPLGGLILKLVTVWNIDCLAPDPVDRAPDGMRVAVLIPTYNEPAEVIAPTVAAACALAPDHETWVLDDGDRAWVAEMCASYGARYLSRPTHEHAKAGNLNHALAVMKTEADAGRPDIDIVAVLDCDHVPLPTFLTATLGWFADDQIALVQGPQAFYNSGAFDDDGISGEQGLFFNVMMPARHHAGAGPFWCGSTSLLRVSALREVGGVATETITEDMHTTLKLIRRGWRTAYHHQTLAVGLAPATAEQYLLQRRRWGLGAMQILTYERLWAAKRWLSWRNFHEYLNGTLWWLEGIATLVAFLVPVAVLLSGAQTSTANPLIFAAVFIVAFTVRLWGARLFVRKQIHWPTAFALRIMRVPVGMACLWWLVTRQVLTFQVTPKGASDDRHKGVTPRILWVIGVALVAVLLYAAAGTAGWVPWRTTTGSTVAAGLWLAVAGIALTLGTRRISAAEYATSRRNAHRTPVPATVHIDGIPADLVDISVGGAGVRYHEGAIAHLGLVDLTLPGATPIKMMMARIPRYECGHEYASLQAITGDWTTLKTMSLWLFHTPPEALPALPPGAPAIAKR
jgi:cellulose synthase (UDP-forming)